MVCLFLFNSGTIKSSSDRIGLVWKLCFDSSELRAGKLALLINDGDSLLIGRVKNPGDLGSKSSEMSACPVSVDRNASRNDVRFSLECALDILTDDGISVVDVGILVSSMSGSSVGSMILLFLRCGISTFVGLSFFVLFKIVISFNGIALLVKFLLGAFAVVIGIMVGVNVVMSDSSVDFKDADGVIDGATTVVAFLLSAYKIASYS